MSGIVWNEFWPGGECVRADFEGWTAVQSLNGGFFTPRLDAENAAPKNRRRTQKAATAAAIHAAQDDDALADVLLICLLIGQPTIKYTAESNKSLGLHRLLNPTSHCTNYGSDLLDPTVCMHFTV